MKKKKGNLLIGFNLVIFMLSWFGLFLTRFSNIKLYYVFAIAMIVSAMLIEILCYIKNLWGYMAILDNLMIILKMILGVIILIWILYEFYIEIKKNNAKQEFKKTKVDTLKRIEKMNKEMEKTKNENIRKNNIQK